jgi:tetratricopeptide (TPR) repeat protein
MGFSPAPWAQAHPGLHHDIERRDALLAAEPERAGLYVERATLYRRDGQFASALADLDRAERLDSDDRSIVLERGLTLAAMGRDSDGEIELTRYIDAGGPGTTAYAERARIRVRAARFDAAIADYDAALARKPDVELYLARGKLQEDRSDLDAAAAGYAEALRQLGDAFTVRAALVRVESGRGRHDHAIALIDEALARTPVRTEWLLQRANTCEAAGRPGEAASDRQRARDEAERHVALRRTALALCTRARVLIALDRIAEADADVRAASAMAPAFADVAHLRAQLAAATVSSSTPEVTHP